eukprot:GHRR01003582.1.p1 GENE.GHRR01003582.1~~GHRR01003582.1.p1  ORF type:complete len:520 (+),score=248.42 GHRR01003582.1:494-2053(+)
MLNDLPGAFSLLSSQQASIGLKSVKQEPAAEAAAVADQSAQVDLAQSVLQPQRLSHRAVTTAMPMNTSSGRPFIPGAPVVDDDSDTNSAATMPMPNKRRRFDDDEVTSSPNDLVEVPSTTVITTASGTRPKTGSGDSSRAAANAAGGGGSQAPTAAAAVPLGAAADTSVVKAILVAKVLTKSDSNSKRIILPRIAVEANLPQLSHAQVFNFSATDPTGQSWPLVIKAWANGQNPKPVYVLEQVGELLKQYKLTVGDAVALLASHDGRFFLEWNTEAARTAAARPTYSAFTFKHQPPQQQQVKADTAQTDAAVAAVDSPAAAAADAPEEPNSVKDAAENAADCTPVIKHESSAQQQQPIMLAQQLQPQAHQRQQQLQHGYATAGTYPNMAPGPLMTAVPVTSMPLVSGTFIPTSPCQLLVMNDPANGDAPYLQLDDPLPSLPMSMLMLKTRSDAATELQDVSNGESLLLPLPDQQAEAGEDGTLHAGGFLLCPRTPGCTRPAGHQGWCLGHKGYRKRGRA